MIRNMGTKISQNLISLLLASACSVSLGEELKPDEEYDYAVDVPSARAVTYGACRIGSEYNIFLTGGYVAQSVNHLEWNFDNIFEPPIEMSGGADLIVCSTTPYIFSRDYGLYIYRNKGWSKIGGAKKNATFFYETTTRSIVVESGGYIYESSNDGWKKIGPSSGNDRLWPLYDDEIIQILGVEQNGSLKLIINDSGNSRRVEKFINLKDGEYVSFFKVGEEIYFSKVSGERAKRVSVYRLTREFEIQPILVDGKYIYEGIGPYKCVGVSERLVSCRDANGLLFFSDADRDGLGVVRFYPAKYFEGFSDKPRVVYGADAVYLEYGVNEGEVIQGRVMRFSYSSIVKRIASKKRAPTSRNK